MRYIILCFFFKNSEMSTRSYDFKSEGSEDDFPTVFHISSCGSILFINFRNSSTYNYFGKYFNPLVYQV